jgi:monofunctional biosynthetic peptidoglycan transglycosylase
MKVHSSGTLNNARVHKPRSPALRVVRILLLSVLIAHCVYIFVTGALIFIYKFTNPPTTFLMIYRSLVNRWDVQKPIPLQTSQIPSYLRRMLVSVEDGKFYDHHGIDMEAFKRARDLNQKIGRPMYGGSTITMQVARTLFLLPNKSYLRKYLEVIAALEMEVILSKARILELYFGYAEWGKGIFGIERASRLYYGKGVASIQVDQAARLIALLSSPIKYKPDTIYKSSILRERYEFLVRRYVAPVAAATPSSDNLPPGGVEPSADISTPDDIVSPASEEEGRGAAGEEQSAAPEQSAVFPEPPVQEEAPQEGGASGVR